MCVFLCHRGRLGHGQMRLRRLSLLAVADFYLLGVRSRGASLTLSAAFHRTSAESCDLFVPQICEHFMMMFTSAFPDQAVIRFVMR